MNKPRVIAFYLPQYHPTPENDKWWGKGFTEWTNVAKAKPLFKGHSRKAQADLAREAGIEGFCYWHYWFNGKELLDYPFKEVLRLGEPDFPFCLAWANHSWYKNHWSTNNSIVAQKSVLLIGEEYGGVEDYTNHFYSYLNAFKDKRYIKVKDKLLFMIYNPWSFSDFPLFAKTWNSLAEKEKLPGFYFVTHIYDIFRLSEIDKLGQMGYEAINVALHRNPFESERRFKNTFFDKILRKLNVINVKPNIVKYSDALSYLDSELFEKSNIYPTLIPNWDHSPRSGRFGRVMQDCTPKLFGKHIDMIFDRVKNKNADDRIVFLKSWNEWGEGNYVEPDLKYGTGYLEELKIRLVDA